MHSLKNVKKPIDEENYGHVETNMLTGNLFQALEDLREEYSP
jgi:hypothetical protein